MPHNPALKARLPEWNTVLDALRLYRTHLEERMKTLDDESEEYLLAYDDLERLAGLIPSFEKQISELSGQEASLVHQ
jgi:hypothetical protein